MATIYIDPTWTGTKSGTLALPYDSWASVSWVAGNTYLQKEGTTFAGSITVGASGTSDSVRVTLGTYDAATGAQIRDKSRRAAVNANGGQFGISTNFTTRNFVTIDTMEVYGCRHATSPIGIYWPTGNGTDLRVLGCYVRDIVATSTPNGNSGGIKAFSDRSKYLDNDIAGISDDGILIEGDDVEIAHNRISYVSVGSTFGDGIQIASATISSNYPWVHHNHVDHRSDDAKQCIIVNFGAAGGTGGVIEDNTCLGYVASTSNQPIYSGHADIVIRRNICLDGLRGIQVAEQAERAKIYSNLIVITRPVATGRGIQLTNNDQQCFNNTVLCLDETADCYGIEQQNYTGVSIRNNIVGGWKYGLRVFAGTGYVETFNNLHGNTNAIVNESLASVTPHASDLTSDPLLSTGYRPMPGSPLIGAGTHISYARDVEGKQRPNPPSIGAYDVATLRRKLTADPAA